MLRVNMHEAKTNLSALAAKAEAGETIELMRAGKVVAVLGPRGKIKRKLGLHPDAAPGRNWDSKTFNREIAKGFLVE